MRSAQLAPRKYERHVSRIGGTSGGLGRGGHTRDVWCKIHIEKVLAPGGCWEWRGYLDKDGYGKITVAGRRSVRAHRWLWEQERNALARGEVLVGLCGNRACVNPAHKRVGQQSDAIRNLIECGRKAPPPDNRGALGPNAKLTDDDVLFIRAQRKAYGLVPVLAALYGVSCEAISAVRRRKSWTHLGNGNAQNAMPLAELRDLVVQRAAERESIDDYATARAAE